MTRAGALGVLALTACAQPIYVADRATAMLGKTEAEVIAAWGQAYVVGVNEDEGAVDGKTLTYHFRSFQEMVVQGTWAELLARSRCAVIFTLDRGRVKYSTVRGNGCA